MKKSNRDYLLDLLIHNFTLLLLCINVLDELVSILGIMVLGEEFEGNLIFLYLLGEENPLLFGLYWSSKAVLVIGFSSFVIVVVRSLLRGLRDPVNNTQYYVDTSFLFVSLVSLAILSGFIAVQPFLWSMTMVIGKNFVVQNFEMLRYTFWAICTLFFLFIFNNPQFWEQTQQLEIKG